MQRIVKSRLVILCCLPFVFLSACQKSLPDVDFSTVVTPVETSKTAAGNYVVCDVTAATGTVLANQKGQTIRYDQGLWYGNMDIYGHGLWLGGTGAGKEEVELVYTESVTVLAPEWALSDQEARVKYWGSDVTFLDKSKPRTMTTMGFCSIAEKVTYRADNSMEVEGIPGDFILYFYNSQGKRVDLKVSAQRRVVARMAGDELIVEEVEGDYTIETEP